ncbi:CYFA0S09e01794g1_1 [Cyberlindnera fabianii]|uniref:CYFA0S09e01794g1_1 n=1 Tax=Cyberlindnera fabianii TaxID=36022 RepID=A0A061AYN6_CYBFA|nr:hypothetical protein BON22_2631 [Cyberlindnera fabianii]CDR42352.1 CYFA0S09e01794g1_1 [Cyberlindnera fabianii]
MASFTSNGPSEQDIQTGQSITDVTQAPATTAPVSNEQKTAQQTTSTKGKRQIENVPFHYQFGEVEKAISNFTKHQPFNHHYAPNVHVNNGSNNNHNSGNNNRNHHHHHHNNNRGGHNNSHNSNNYHSNGSNRLQPQTFTMNAQLKQQQQQQFLSSAAQQINNRYKSNNNMNNGNMNNMVNVQPNSTMAINNMSQVPQMNQMSNMSHSMSNMSSMNQMSNIPTMNGIPANTMASNVSSQLPQQSYMNTQYTAAQQPQQQPHQQSLQLGTGFMSGQTDLKYDTFPQTQPQLSHGDYYSPMRNTSPQFSAPARPGSVGAFGSPLEQITSNSSFGIAADMNSPMTNASSSVLGDFGGADKKLVLDESAYLGDIWGSSKGLRNSSSVWA